MGGVGRAGPAAKNPPFCAAPTQKAHAAGKEKRGRRPWANIGWGKGRRSQRVAMKPGARRGRRSPHCRPTAHAAALCTPLSPLPPLRPGGGRPREAVCTQHRRQEAQGPAPAAERPLGGRCTCALFVWLTWEDGLHGGEELALLGGVAHAAQRRDELFHVLRRRGGEGGRRWAGGREREKVRKRGAERTGESDRRGMRRGWCGSEGRRANALL